MAGRARPSGRSSASDAFAALVRAARRYRIPVSLGGGAALVITAGSAMMLRAESKTNTVALSDAPKPVTVVPARAATFRPARSYVGTTEPWLEARIGPQLVSAYVATVLVRPGATVKKGDVLATLDCKSASALNQAVAMEARALEARQKALATEAKRFKSLREQHYVSDNEAEQKESLAESQRAELLARQAKLLGTSFEVDDCVLRAPFDGEIATRTIDPGAFVRPGSAIVSLIDRSVVRVTADAPEIDFEVVAPGSKATLHVLATETDLEATVARRAPSADETTRTVHFELDVPNAARALPVGTTAEVRIEVGKPIPAVTVPLAAATVRGANAALFVVEGTAVHSRTAALLGERSGILYLEPSLGSGARVVTEGRALLADGDAVAATLADSDGGGGR